MKQQQHHHHHHHHHHQQQQQQQPQQQKQQNRNRNSSSSNSNNNRNNNNNSKHINALHLLIQIYYTTTIVNLLFQTKYPSNAERLQKFRNLVSENFSFVCFCRKRPLKRALLNSCVRFRVARFFLTQCTKT
jgi:hypothetical protein